MKSIPVSSPYTQLKNLLVQKLVSSGVVLASPSMVSFEKTGQKKGDVISGLVGSFISCYFKVLNKNLTLK